MNWIEQNSADADMLKRIDLRPLDDASVDGDVQLTEAIALHNRAIIDLNARFENLVEDRQVLANADKWLAREAEVVAAERRRVVAESWDALVTLRVLLADRRALLERIESHLAAKTNHLAEQLKDARSSVRQSLSRKHRQFLKAEPVHGPAYIAEQAEGDDGVTSLRQQVNRWERVLQSIQSLHYRSVQDSPLTFRQRDMYAHVN